jgi:3',5'-cyclic-AMP phosphodiesterase
MQKEERGIHIQLKFSLIILTFFFEACNKFESSPYQNADRSGLPSELNRMNLDKLRTKTQFADDTVRIVFSGDTQRFYDEVELLVEKTKDIPHVDFLILAGDITDFGLAAEFLWIHSRLDKLHVPYVCVIGNHDLIANGEALYEKIFGEKNFSFRFRGYKFIFHDTNGREYGFNGQVPDLAILDRELQDSTVLCIGVSHVPPFNEDFDPTLEAGYSNLLASKPAFLLSLHGHLHGGLDTNWYNDHVRYMVTPTVGKREAYLIKMVDTVIIKQTFTF